MAEVDLNVKLNRPESSVNAESSWEFPKCREKTQESLKKIGAISVVVRAVRSKSGIRTCFGRSG